MDRVIKKEISTGHTLHYEYNDGGLLQKTDGIDNIEYNPSSLPTSIYYENGIKTGYMGVSMDISERIKNERELKKFKLALNEAPGAVFIMDKNSNFEYINPQFTKISGYTEEDLLHKNINDTLYRGISGVPESRKEIINTLSEGKTWQGELLTIHKNGSKYWANTIAAPFKNELGELDGFIVIQQDITERLNFEKTIRESEAKYKALVENSQDGIIITQNGKFKFVNHAMCRMLEYSAEEFYAMEGVVLVLNIRFLFLESFLEQDQNQLKIHDNTHQMP